MNQRKYVSNLSTDEKVFIGIIRVAEGFKRAHSAIFRKHGLSFPQYNVLRALDASHKGRNNIIGVSKIMLVPQANITGIVKRMEKEGFLLRKSDPSDERVTVLEITPKGRKTLKKIEREKDDSLQVVLADFTPEDRQRLLVDLRRLIASNSDLFPR